MLDKTLLEQLNKEVEGERPKLPAKVIKISYDPEFHYGSFYIPPEDKEQGKPEVLSKTISFIPVREFGRYTRFNPKLNRSDIVSNFFNPFDAKKAIDKFTKQLISKIKESADPAMGDIKYKQYLFGYLVKGDKLERALIVLSGATLRSFIEIQPQINKIKYWRGGSIFTISTKREKKGSVNYFSLDIVVSDTIPEKLLAELGRDITIYIDNIKEFVNKSNSFMATDEAVESEAVENEEDLSVDF